MKNQRTWLEPTVYLLYELDNQIINGKDQMTYDISRTYMLEDIHQAMAFSSGLNEGLEKGRCDVHVAVLKSEYNEETKTINESYWPRNRPKQL